VSLSEDTTRKMDWQHSLVFRAKETWVSGLPGSRKANRGGRQHDRWSGHYDAINRQRKGENVPPLNITFGSEELGSFAKQGHEVVFISGTGWSTFMGQSQTRPDYEQTRDAVCTAAPVPDREPPKGWSVRGVLAGNIFTLPKPWRNKGVVRELLAQSREFLKQMQAAE
jgi:hypothetical protein